MTLEMLTEEEWEVVEKEPAGRYILCSRLGMIPNVVQELVRGTKICYKGSATERMVSKWISAFNDSTGYTSRIGSSVRAKSVIKFQYISEPRSKKDTPKGKDGKSLLIGLKIKDSAYNVRSNRAEPDHGYELQVSGCLLPEGRRSTNYKRKKTRPDGAKRLAAIRPGWSDFSFSPLLDSTPQRPAGAARLILPDTLRPAGAGDARAAADGPGDFSAVEGRLTEEIGRRERDPPPPAAGDGQNGAIPVMTGRLRDEAASARAVAAWNDVSRRVAAKLGRSESWANAVQVFHRWFCVASDEQRLALLLRAPPGTGTGPRPPPALQRQTSRERSPAAAAAAAVAEPEPTPRAASVREPVHKYTTITRSGRVSRPARGKARAVRELMGRSPPGRRQDGRSPPAKRSHVEIRGHADEDLPVIRVGSGNPSIKEQIGLVGVLEGESPRPSDAGSKSSSEPAAAGAQPVTDPAATPQPASATPGSPTPSSEEAGTDNGRPVAKPSTKAQSGSGKPARAEKNQYAAQDEGEEEDSSSTQ